MIYSFDLSEYPLVEWRKEGKRRLRLRLTVEV